MDLVKTTKEERRELREKVALVMQDEGDPVGDWQKVLDVIDDLDEALVHAKAAEAELAGWKRDCHAAEDAEHSFGNAFITANAAAAQLHSAASAMLKAVELAHDCEDIHFGNRPETRTPGGGVDCRIITDMRVALDGSTTGQITGPSGAEGPKNAAAFSTSPNASGTGASDDARISKGKEPTP